MSINVSRSLPRYIALCGNPGSGKSEAQKLLATLFGAQPVDDGGPLRKIAMDYLGLTHDQVYTQEGKASFVEILGRKWQVREILGELGNKLEAQFGADIMPFMVCNSLSAEGSYSFGSVRRKQGEFYKRAGGMVIGIRAPGVGPSKFEFDQFDHSAVDIWIDNDGLSRGLSPDDARHDLGCKLAEALAVHSLPAIAA